jgi:hypothetical protein
MRSVPRSSSVSLITLFPVVWIGATFQFLSGFTLWMTKPSKYLFDRVFIIKFLLVCSGLVVTWNYFNMLRRESAKWDFIGAVSRDGHVFAATTMAWWSAVLIAGRLTAYLGTLYGQ